MSQIQSLPEWGLLQCRVQTTWMSIQRHDLSDQSLTLTIIMISLSLSLKVVCSIMWHCLHGQPYPTWLDQSFSWILPQKEASVAKFLVYVQILARVLMLWVLLVHCSKCSCGNCECCDRQRLAGVRDWQQSVSWMFSPKENNFLCQQVKFLTTSFGTIVFPRDISSFL